jgi:hypothetical protein
MKKVYNPTRRVSLTTDLFQTTLCIINAFSGRKGGLILRFDCIRNFLRVHSRFSLDDPERPIICESKSELVGYHFDVKFTVYIFIFDFPKLHNGFDQDYREQKMENFVGFVII